jgi:hypothetical protein
MEGELLYGGVVTCFVDANPAIARYPEEMARLVVGKRQLLARQDRYGEERAVIQSPKEEVTGAADVTQCAGGRRYGVQGG